jgi:hypothetical protein
MKAINIIAIILVIVGALNWGLVGLFGFNLVSAIFGAMTVLSRLIYILVGIAGVYVAVASRSMLSTGGSARVTA